MTCGSMLMLHMLAVLVSAQNIGITLMEWKKLIHLIWMHISGFLQILIAQHFGSRYDILYIQFMLLIFTLICEINCFSQVLCYHAVFPYIIMRFMILPKLTASSFAIMFVLWGILNFIKILLFQNMINKLLLNHWYKYDIGLWIPDVITDKGDDNDMIVCLSTFKLLFIIKSFSLSIRMPDL